VAGRGELETQPTKAKFTSNEARQIHIARGFLNALLAESSHHLKWAAPTSLFDEQIARIDVDEAGALVVYEPRPEVALDTAVR